MGRDNYIFFAIDYSKLNCFFSERFPLPPGVLNYLTLFTLVAWVSSLFRLLLGTPGLNW